MKINVRLMQGRSGLWAWEFDHRTIAAWRGGFFSMFAAMAHARECAAGIGREVKFI